MRKHPDAGASAWRIIGVLTHLRSPFAYFFKLPRYSSFSSCTVFFVNRFYRSSLYSPLRIALVSFFTSFLSYFSVT